LPLRKPQDIPKIPKARKKKAHTLLNAIPSKKPDKLEYICKAYYMYDSKLKRQYCVFAIETIVEFTSFAYEISVEVIREKNIFYFIVTGLKAKMDAVPTVQPARKDLLFEDLIGEYTVNVVKQDGAINSAEYKFNIYKKEIILQKEYRPKKKNNRLFCGFKIAEEEFSFAP
jgi:hypothetical protein